MKKKSLLDVAELFDRRIPIAITAVFLLQAGTAIWWAATKEADDHYQAERVDHLQIAIDGNAAAQTQNAERLARIEERLKSESETLARIEKQMGSLRP